MQFTLSMLCHFIACFKKWIVTGARLRQIKKRLKQTVSHNCHNCNYIILYYQINQLTFGRITTFYFGSF